ncbi:MFS transporter [Modicisalibacter tunisiensis]|uniref:MFS transporter n=1 Tax=Modicisalibacter tunisiensis TaxID=390637 RepID=A0ABS7X4X2_9GAMM|nr:MFS transporter [Modicisalibacter tunisiensis]MBZ9537501.1 MFS transporter [Modicisalibacter tunisiensis]MBZ9569077.1 MFS transporter [Modicisalibacter tunisiensis]
MEATTATAATPRTQPGRLTGMSWAHFLNDGAANYLPGVLPAILVSLNLSVALAGTIMAALLMGQALQPLVGLLADRVGGRVMVALGLAGSSLGGALVGFTSDVWALLGVLVLIGVSNSFFHPQALAGVRRLGGDKPGTAMSIFLVGGEVGRGVWPAIASWVVVQWGLAYLWVLALPALLTLPFLLRWAPSLPPRAGDAAPVQWRCHAGPLTRLVAFSTLRSLMIFSVVTFVPLMWTQAGGSLTTGASFITVMLVIGVIGNVGGGHLSDRLGRRPLLIAAMSISVVMLAAFLMAEGLWLWIALGVLGICLFATLPLTILIAQDILPENRSLGSGMALGLSNGLAALGIMALGPIAAEGGATAPLWVALAGGIVTVPLALGLPEHVRRDSR